MEDIAVSIGAMFISEDIGMNLETTEPSVMGSAKKVIITKEDTIILGGHGDKQAIQDRVEIIKNEIEKSNSDYAKEKAQERLGKLTGGVVRL